MKLRLTQIAKNGATVTLAGTLPAQDEAALLGYRTRTGALLRVDAVAAGAYDREHHDVLLPSAPKAREISLEVEREALPTNGLPSGPGFWWWLLNALSHQRPSKVVRISNAHCHGERAPDGAPAEPRSSEVETRGNLTSKNETPLIGHSHLDVAWLWTYAATRRKAQRTFAIACDLFERDPSFVFVQSQPQLYRFVEEDDPALFERVLENVRAKRFDPHVAALWVESDCNLPSGESLFRQMLFAHEYCMEKFGIAPSIAWLPDSFGFANTLPELLAHAGIPYFATTKLQWNDTTKFPYPQFVWRGPDGSEVIGALLQSYDGGPYPWRVKTAKDRREPLILGYGDGGGGVTPRMLEQARSLGTWIHPHDWFVQLDAERGRLPVHTDELYLEYHRGVYTTHHDVKLYNAGLERALSEAEELVAWCDAVGASRATVDRLCEGLSRVWEIVLRNQFHDVLPGTSIRAVYKDVADEYAQAERQVLDVMNSAQAMLPRVAAAPKAAYIKPRDAGGAYEFENEHLRARVKPDGTIVELRTAAGENVCTEANILALYDDRPRQWEAWNIDDGYQRSQQRVAATGHLVEDDGLAVVFESFPANMRIRLVPGEPFLRVTLWISWTLSRKLLRIENDFGVRTDQVVYGSPHGTIARSALRETPEQRAKFEVPGQRFAAARDDRANGIAMLALDTYGWSAQRGEEGIALGHSLLRSTTWPDPHADFGEYVISYAFMPLAAASNGSLERAWVRFAHESRVRLFTCDDESVVITCCKPAQDRDGVIVRVRECDGGARTVRLRCGARVAKAHAVDALERRIVAPVSLEAEELVFDLAPFQLRSFRVTFRR